MTYVIPSAFAVIVTTSVCISLFFEEALWRNYLCPYGTILHLTSWPAAKGVIIGETARIACGKCQKACAARAIDTLDTRKRKYEKATLR